MASEFIGLQMMVTMRGTPPMLLKGTVSAVEAGTGLTLSNGESGPLPKFPFSLFFPPPPPSYSLLLFLVHLLTFVLAEQSGSLTPRNGSHELPFRPRISSISPRSPVNRLYLLPPAASRQTRLLQPFQLPRSSRRRRLNQSL